jgi:malonyl-CoA O-methyltransferase
MGWLNRKRKPEILSPLDGYNLWAASYKNETNPIKDWSDKLVQKLLPDLNGKSILDYGCGTGKFCHFAESKQASRIVGIDLSPAMIEQAKKLSNKTEFICGDIRQVHLPKNCFDVIITALVLGHVENLGACLDALLQTMKTGGSIVITDFHPFLTMMNAKRTFSDPSTSKQFEVRHHLHLFEEYFSAFHRNGFIVDTLEEPQYNNAPVIFAMRAAKK